MHPQNDKHHRGFNKVRRASTFIFFFYTPWGRDREFTAPRSVTRRNHFTKTRHSSPRQLEAAVAAPSHYRL